MKLSNFVENGMNEVRQSFLALTGTLGLLAAAAPPAIMFAFASFHALETVIGYSGALAVGIALAVALECTGVKISHVALDFFRLWRQGDNEALPTFIISALLTGVYLASGAGAVYFFDSNPVVRLTGFLSYAVAGIMYVASGLEMLFDARQGGMVARLKQAIDNLQAKYDSQTAMLGGATRKHDKALAELDKARQELVTIRQSVDTIRQERDTAIAERDKALSDLDSSLSQRGIDLSTLPAPLSRYVELVASGVTPNGQLVNEFGIGESTMTRVNSALLKDGGK